MKKNNSGQPEFPKIQASFPDLLGLDVGLLLIPVQPASLPGNEVRVVLQYSSAWTRFPKQGIDIFGSFAGADWESYKGGKDIVC